MIFHPGRTGSCIMRPRRAVSCLLKLNPPARIGKKEMAWANSAARAAPKSGFSFLFPWPCCVPCVDCRLGPSLLPPGAASPSPPGVATALSPQP